MVNNEVEREVLALILILIIFVSLLGTWAILKVVGKTEAEYNPQANAEVSLNILPTPQQSTDTTVKKGGAGNP